jgi:hypothetical protein
LCWAEDGVNYQRSRIYESLSARFVLVVSLDFCI